MNALNISVNVNVDFSESTKTFLKELLSCKTVKVPEAKVPEAKAPEAKAPEAKAPEAETTNVSVTIDDVRKALSLKVNEHRSEIKDKLNELGAPSVTKLDTSKYQEMYDFLNSL